ncbi:MAG: tripartite tricarboxylate transporter substrate binding protein [Betaproteobacteria bacterium]|jgi:tripartite-type tricarboxylate transporter receptor subunit TctC|nr:tripartite tricarboxylate transporter substrate binding protein [Betaproteobacteria bacterium]
MQPIRHAVAAVLVLATLGAAHAQGYPNRAVRFIIPQSPGSATDTVARLIGTRLAERFGQPVVHENRTGAGGVIGAELMVKSAPDGYTILIISATHTVNPSLRKSLPYDSINDFAPVTMATAQPYVMLAHPSLPVKGVKELIALARARPGQINFASSGAGTLGHLGFEQLKTTAKVNMVHVPYKSIGAAMADIVGGHITLLYSTVVSGMPQVNAGRLRALAVSSPKRAQVAPNVPTVAESGFPGYEVTGWYGVVAPAKTPPEIINRLNSEITAILRLPAVTERLAGDGSEAVANTPEQFGAHIRAEIAKWGQVVKAAGITAD